MTFYKVSQTINTKIPIFANGARNMICGEYGENNADRHMATLRKDGVFGLGFWNLYYKED